MKLIKQLSLCISLMAMPLFLLSQDSGGISRVNGMTMGAPETHSFSVKYNF